jgi:hypothetical protein
MVEDLPCEQLWICGKQALLVQTYRPEVLNHLVIVNKVNKKVLLFIIYTKKCKIYLF